MLVLAVSPQVLDAELPLARRELEVLPEGWTGIARMGKLRRLSGDRAGLQDLARAADTYLGVANDNDPTDLMTPANLLRLAGEDARAKDVFDRMRRGIHELGDQCTPYDRAHLVEVCFFLDLDEETIATAAALQGGRARSQRPGTGLRHVVVADLAAARRDREPDACRPVIDWFDAAIKKEKPTPFDTGHVSLHDWLEVALTLHSELSGVPSPRLREL